MVELFSPLMYVILPAVLAVDIIPASPKDTAKVPPATLASFVYPDELRDCSIGTRYHRQENSSKQFHFLRPLQLTRDQLSWVNIELQTFGLVQELEKGATLNRLPNDSFSEQKVGAG